MPHHRNDFGPRNMERTDGRLAAERMAAATARKFFIVEEAFLEWRKDPQHMGPITRWKTSSRSLRSNNRVPKSVGACPQQAPRTHKPKWPKIENIPPPS
jgi:hypothetical protein